MSFGREHCIQYLPPVSIIDVYDSAGGQSVSSSPSTLSLDATRRMTDDGTYTFGSDEITVKHADTFAVQFRVTTASLYDTDVEIWLERDQGAGYVEVPGTKGRILGRQ